MLKAKRGLPDSPSLDAFHSTYNKHSAAELRAAELRTCTLVLAKDFHLQFVTLTSYLSYLPTPTVSFAKHVTIANSL